MSAHSYRADAIVVGGGLAGIVTALELLDHDRSVVLLERSSETTFGGLARESFGGIFFVDSPEQRRSGIADSPDLALTDWLTFGELDSAAIWPRRWAEAYTHRCLEEVRGWLAARAVRFFPVVHWVERGLFVAGNSVPRFHMAWGTGRGLVSALLERLHSHRNRDRLQLCFEHRVDELLRSGGLITGCRGQRAPQDGDDDSGNRDFEAAADALVIAAGGIAGNLDLVRKHWEPSWGTAPDPMLNGSNPNADGRMHSAVEQAGGHVTNLQNMWNYAAGVHHWKPQFPNHGLSLVPPKSALWLDYQGRRLGAPPLITGYDTRYLVETVCRQPVPYSWQVLNWRIAKKELAVSGAEFNDAIRDRKLLRFVLGVLLGNASMVREFIDNCADFVTGDSLAELATKMNTLTGNNDVDPTVLEAEVQRYDANVARGSKLHNDDQLRRISQARRYRGDRVRTCKSARIDDARARPLIAIREHILTRKSLGGVQTDLQCRVLDATGEPVPGLFAVGEAAGFGGGGIHGKRSLEGTFLGCCVLTGRVAGQAIAAS